MKYTLLFSLTLFALSSAGCIERQSGSPRISRENSDTMKAEDLKFSISTEIDLLCKTDSGGYGLAWLEDRGDSIDINYFQVLISLNGDGQKYLKTERIPTKELSIVKKELQKKYDYQPYAGLQIYFVQIQLGDIAEIDAVNKRQQVEIAIGNELSKVSAGEWIAGDLGPGGANMLFMVRDYNTALPIIHKVLKEQKLDRSVLIGRRFNLTKDDWIYLVVYPQKYYGSFNTL